MQRHWLFLRNYRDPQPLIYERALRQAEQEARQKEYLETLKVTSRAADITAPAAGQEVKPGGDTAGNPAAHNEATSSNTQANIIKTAAENVAPEMFPFVIKYTYSVMSVLDSKASALMRFDAVILALLIFYMSESSGRLGYADAALTTAIAAFTLASIFLCLFVVAVSWPFWGLAVPSTGEFKPIDEMQELSKALEYREKCYMLSWTSCMIAVVLVAIFALVVAVRTTIGVEESRLWRSGLLHDARLGAPHEIIVPIREVLQDGNAQSRPAGHLRPASRPGG